MKDQSGFSRRKTFCIGTGSRQVASQFLNPASKTSQETAPNPYCAVSKAHSKKLVKSRLPFYRPVSLCRDDTVLHTPPPPLLLLPPPPPPPPNDAAATSDHFVEVH